MKAIAPIVLMFTALLSVRAQGTFRAALTSAPENSWLPARAEFSLRDSSVSFVITIGYEGIVPDTARLLGPGTKFDFAPGPPFIVVHSPGGEFGWPDGYDGATIFYGSFVLPESLLNQFVNGFTTLHLLGSEVGDFSGAVVPTFSIERVASNVVLSWPAATTNFVLESTTNLATPNWVTATNAPTVVGNKNTVTEAARDGSRFYRLKRL